LFVGVWAAKKIAAAVKIAHRAVGLKLKLPVVIFSGIDFFSISFRQN
jgi:hypothetical protein